MSKGRQGLDESTGCILEGHKWYVLAEAVSKHKGKCSLRLGLEKFLICVLASACSGLRSY